MKIGSLFSGVAGLDRAVESFFDAQVAWFVEFDKAPSKVLAHHYPDVPNYGDVTTVDWANVEPIDILTGGFPCQDVSLAGARRGLRDGTRSGLWSEYAKAIDILRPKVVVIENVRGLLSAQTIEEVDAPDSELEPGQGGMGEPARGDRPVLNAFGRVLGDLAELGYDAEWVGLRAADAGAPHNRFRVFCVAYPQHTHRGGRRAVGLAGVGEEMGRWREDTGHSAEASDTGSCCGPSTDAYADDIGHEWAREARHRGAGSQDNDQPASDSGSNRFSGGQERNSEPERPELEASRGLHADGRVTSTRATSPNPQGGRRGVRVGDDERATGGDVNAPGDDCAPTGGTPRASTDWGQYEPAIRRWEQVIGRVAPEPTVPNEKTGSHRLSAEFTTWMMGWPAGWVTDPAIGLTRNEQLKACGNGVVTQQALLALETIAARNARAA